MAYMTTVTVSEARARLPSLLDRVARGEEVTITRHGQPAAALVAPDALRASRNQATFEDADRVWEILRRARSSPIPAGRGFSRGQAERLIAEIRRDRGAR